MTKELERMYYLLTAMVENGVTSKNGIRAMEEELYNSLIVAIMRNTPSIIKVPKKDGTGDRDTIDRTNNLESNVLKNSGIM